MSSYSLDTHSRSTAQELPSPGRANPSARLPIVPIGRQALVDKVADAVAGLTDQPEPGTWVVTDSLGFILDANLAGAQLLNGTVRGLQRRNLVLFFADNRPAWQSALTRALTGERVIHSGRLRPKERRPVMLTVEISRATGWERPALQWIFQLSGSPTG